MKKKYSKRFKMFYSLYCEVKHYGEFETEMSKRGYNEEVSSVIWDLFTDY